MLGYGKRESVEAFHAERGEFGGAVDGFVTEQNRDVVHIGERGLVLGRVRPRPIVIALETVAHRTFTIIVIIVGRVETARFVIERIRRQIGADGKSFRGGQFEEHRSVELQTLLGRREKIAQHQRAGITARMVEDLQRIALLVVRNSGTTART